MPQCFGDSVTYEEFIWPVFSSVSSWRLPRHLITGSLGRTQWRSDAVTEAVLGLSVSCPRGPRREVWGGRDGKHIPGTGAVGRPRGRTGRSSAAEHVRGGGEGLANSCRSRGKWKLDLEKTFRDLQWMSAFDPLMFFVNNCAELVKGLILCRTACDAAPYSVYKICFYLNFKFTLRW